MSSKEQTEQHVGQKRSAQAAETQNYDIAIIGGGVVGGMIAYHLAKYRSHVVILEKEHDAAMGQSKANSGIVHAGYDPRPGSLKAILNVAGSEMMEEVCRNLAVKYRRNGTLVVGFGEEDQKNLEILLERGKQNGVRALSLISGQEARAAEKNLSERVTCALDAPTGAVVCPYELTLRAIGHAMDYGTDFLTDFEVSAIHSGTEAVCKKSASAPSELDEPDAWSEAENGYCIEAADGRQVRAKIVLNCAGLFADEIAAMVGDTSFHITPRRGEYQLLDKEAGDLVTHTIFRTPTRMGKGVLAVRTVDGNILLGPTSEDIEDKRNTAVTAAGLETVAVKESEFFDHVPMQMAITQFTGLRAHGDQGDFIINSPRPNFLNFAGIESPGLSSAPAIGLLAEALLFGETVCPSGAALAKRAGLAVPLIEEGALAPVRKEEWKPQQTERVSFRELSLEEKNALIAKEPAYGRVICRCEEVTEGEILAEIRRNPPAKDIDAVKRRTRAGMGRCQSGFCMPAVCEILAKEWGVPLTEVTKKGGGSYILTGRTKGAGASEAEKSRAGAVDEPEQARELRADKAESMSREAYENGGVKQ